MAHSIYGELRRRADYFIDFHTTLTPGTRWALFANAPGEVGRKAEGMARAFGRRSTPPAPMEILGGAAMMAATRDGIPSLIGSRVCARQRGCGAFVVHRLFRALDPRQLSGILVGLPILNIRAFTARQRMSPFEGFAWGRPQPLLPRPSRRHAHRADGHAISTKLRAHANYFVDLHTAMTADVRWALFLAAAGTVGTQAEAWPTPFSLSPCSTMNRRGGQAPLELLRLLTVPFKPEGRRKHSTGRGGV